MNGSWRWYSYCFLVGIVAAIVTGKTDGGIFSFFNNIWWWAFILAFDGIGWVIRGAYLDYRFKIIKENCNAIKDICFTCNTPNCQAKNIIEKIKGEL